jgi:hypothetical protein
VLGAELDGQQHCLFLGGVCIDRFPACRAKDVEIALHADGWDVDTGLRIGHALPTRGAAA